MKPRILFLFIFCMFFAATKGYCESFNSDWHWTYRGDIAGQPGGLTLVFDQANVAGELYFDSDYISIPLVGTLDGRQLTLQNDNGLMLHASFRDKDAAYGDAKLDREVIVGNITSDAIANGHIRFKMDHGSAGDLDAMYAIAGIDNDEMVDGFAQDFKDAVLNRDNEKVVAMVHYPLNTDFGEIKDSGDFLLKYDEIFYPEFLAAFKKAIPKNMFSKGSGVMMGSDDNVFWIWIGGDKSNAFITAIFSDKDKLLKKAV